MKRRGGGRAGRCAVWAALAFLSWAPARGQDPVRIAGPPSVIPLLQAAAKMVNAEGGYQVHVAAVAGDGGVRAVGGGQVEIAVITRALTGDDRAQFPDAILTEIPVGAQVVALAVANDVWDGGVHSISKESMRAIYEGRIRDWSDIGGPEEKLVLYNFEPGHGVWEMFAGWLYGDNRKAAIPKVRKVSSNDDAQTALEFTPGAMAAVSPLAADGVRCHALAIETGDGETVAATPANAANKSYPMVRPINLVVNGRPTLNVRAFAEFLTGPKGQELVKAQGAFGLDGVAPPRDNPTY